MEYSETGSHRDSAGNEAIDNLLHSANEWRNIQDIIRVTFKALSDVVRSQGFTIQTLERQMANLKNGHLDVKNELDLKPSRSELTNLITDLEMRYDQHDLKSALEQKISKSEFAHAISKKAGTDDVRQLLEPMVTGQELQSELRKVLQRVDELDSEFELKIEQTASLEHLQDLAASVPDRERVGLLEDALSHVVSKDMLDYAMQRKINVDDIEAYLIRKADAQELHSFAAAVECKADQSWVEQIISKLDDKVDRSEITLKILPELNRKLDRHEMDSIAEQTHSTSKDIHRRMDDFNLDVDKYIGQFKAQLEDFKVKLGNGLQDKVDLREVDNMYQTMSKKVDTETVNELLHIQKADLDETIENFMRENTLQQQKFEDLVFEKAATMEQTSSFLNDEFKRTAENVKKLNDDRQLDFEEHSKWVKTVINSQKSEIKGDYSDLLCEIEKLTSSVDEVISRKVEKSELTDTRAHIMSALHQKPDLTEMKSAMSAQQKDAAKINFEFKEEFKQMMNRTEDQFAQMLQKKASKAELDNIARSRVEMNYFEQFAKDTATVGHFHDLQNELHRLNDSINNSVKLEDLNQHVRTTSNALEDFSKDILLKANIKDVISLLDMKSNIEDVNKVFFEINKELDLKANLDAFSTQVDEQAQVNEALCAENCVARWLWKSGGLGPGNTIPWEMQSVNTCPDNFVWEQNRTSIITVAPGLYEVMFAMFSNSKPTVQLLINGEPVLSTDRSTSYTLHHSSARFSEFHHSTGNIIGLSLMDFVALPARARIAISYVGDTVAEGFMGLRKL